MAKKQKWFDETLDELRRLYEVAYMPRKDIAEQMGFISKAHIGRL